jgi:hypothetical protein
MKGYKVGFNGFVMLNLKGERLVAEYRDIDDQLVLEEAWKIDMQNGQFEWEIVSFLPELAV